MGQRSSSAVGSITSRTGMWARTASCTLRQLARCAVAGRVLVSERGYVGPAPSSTVTASQIVIYVAGTNANIGNLGGLGIKSATFGPFATLAANVVAPNGTLLIRERSKAVGSFVARWVSVGKFSELSLDNRFATTSERCQCQPHHRHPARGVAGGCRSWVPIAGPTQRRCRCRTDDPRRQQRGRSSGCTTRYSDTAGYDRHPMLG